MNAMESFASRKKLIKKTRLEYTKIDGWPVLHLEEPALLARFAAGLKQRAKSGGVTGDVFSRGQTTHHGQMPPSLFRGAASSATSGLRHAEEDLARAVRGSFPLKRFSRPHVPALLQHYGLKTSWLDVVDNLWISVWFATHQFVSQGSGEKLRAVHSPADYGWVYFIRIGAPSARPLQVVDLRRDHHSLSVRPHIQHGISVHAPDATDFTDFVFATVRFPNDFRWTLAGYMFDPGVLFPPRRFDNTLSHLAGPKLRNLIEEVEGRHGLKAGTLGRVSEIVGAAS